MSNYERRSSPVVTMFLGLAIGNLIGSVIAHALQEDPDTRVRNAQIYNAEVYAQLEQAHPVRGLILSDTDHSFSFGSQASDGMAETCTGKYEVQNNQAHVIGDLACTETVQVQPS